MKWLISISLAAFVFHIGNTVYFCMYPSVNTQLLVMLAVLICFILIIVDLSGIFIHWRKHKAIALVPLLIIIGSCVANGPAARSGHHLRIQKFKKNQSNYDTIVTKILKGEIPKTTNEVAVVSDNQKVATIDFRPPRNIKT